MISTGHSADLKFVFHFWPMWGSNSQTTLMIESKITSALHLMLILWMAHSFNLSPLHWTHL